MRLKSTTCFVNDPPITSEVHYLDCLDVLTKGQNKNGIYSINSELKLTVI